MELLKSDSKSDEAFVRMTRSLIERAMEMRCDSYLSHTKHMLLMQTIMNIDVGRRGLAKSNEYLREMDRIKTLFIASMAHELNNPLSAILGYSEMVIQGLAGPLTEQQQVYLKNVLTSAEHLKSLVSDAMDIAKIESNLVESNVQVFDLANVIEESIVACQQCANEKSLIINIDAVQSIQMKTDRRRVLQCLVNLLSNAIKYTDAGQIDIKSRQLDDVVEIAVRDTGVGLSSDDLQHLFEAFRRGGSADRTKAMGSGIGLFLTNKLVYNVLKGTISVESELDKGSTFKMILPLEI